MLPVAELPDVSSVNPLEPSLLLADVLVPPLLLLVAELLLPW